MGGDGRDQIRGLPRFHVCPGQIADGCVTLSPAQSHKLQHVLRLRPGAEIAVMDGSGSFYRCHVTSCGKAGAVAAVEAAGPLPTECPFPITLCQAVPKSGKLDLIVRACTAAGVSRFVIFEAERSVARWPAERVAERIARLQAIAHEGAEVSVRACVPTVVWCESLADVLAGIDCGDPDPLPLKRGRECWFLLYEGARTPLACVLPPRPEAVTLVLGPEGGLSDNEVQAARDAGCGIASLGPRILRTEHAGLYAVATLQALCDLAGW